MAAQDLTNEEFERFQKYIYQVSGIRIRDHKLTLVSNRIRRRLRATGHPDFTSYFRFLTSISGRDELPYFLDEITTNETYFFRDEHHYEWFAKSYLADIVRAAREGKRDRSLRLWSAACSTGEEPYSLALCILDAIRDVDRWSIEILATDLSEAVLDHARTGIYSARSVQRVAPAQLKKYFVVERGVDRWTIVAEPRRLVRFENHNLLEPMKQGPFDCILIKNVLIYFDEASRRLAVNNLLKAMGKPGSLIVGPSEGIFMMLGSLEKEKPWLYRMPA